MKPRNSLFKRSVLNAPVLMQHIIFFEHMSYNSLLLDMPLAPTEDRLQISKLQWSESKFSSNNRKVLCGFEIVWNDGIRFC